jgi:hypothetical protein
LSYDTNFNFCRPSKFCVIRHQICVASQQTFKLVLESVHDTRWPWKSKGLLSRTMKIQLQYVARCHATPIRNNPIIVAWCHATSLAIIFIVRVNRPL